MWGCFLMSGVKILHFLKDWWKSIPIHQNYTMALTKLIQHASIYVFMFIQACKGLKPWLKLRPEVVILQILHVFDRFVLFNCIKGKLHHR